MVHRVKNKEKERVVRNRSMSSYGKKMLAQQDVRNRTDLSKNNPISPRDEPPLGDGVAHTIFLKIDPKGVPLVAGVKNKDPKKPPFYGLPGGRIKQDKKTGAEELPRVADQEEAIEEVGVVIDKGDLFPLCFMTRRGPGRDKNDKETGKIAEYPQYLFLASGDGVLLKETDDPDVEKPMWFPVDEIVGKNSGWFFSHAVLVSIGLQRFGAIFASYCCGAEELGSILPSALDKRFFKNISKSAISDSYVWEAFMRLSTLLKGQGNMVRYIGNNISNISPLNFELYREKFGEI